jgi:hypothetical protein
MSLEAVADAITLYWYDGEAQQSETQSRSVFNSFLEANRALHANYGSIYRCPILAQNRYFACDNIEVLNGYTTFFFVDKEIFYGEIRGDLDNRADSEFPGAPTLYGDLCCYTEAQIYAFTPPGLRLSLGDRAVR